MSDFVLVGSNVNLTPFAYGVEDIRLIPSGITDPEGMSNPTFSSGYPAKVSDIKTQSVVSLQTTKSSTLKSLMGPDYKKVSIMSLDGIFSPVSFYPTPWNTTFHISKYSRSKCPYCLGRGIWETDIPDFNLLDISSIETIAQNTAPVKRERRLCNFCVPDNDKKNSYIKNVSLSETTPPYIVASGDDLAIISNKEYIYSTGNSVINKYTLNPIITNSGEFSCGQNKQKLDFSGHNINILSFGMYAPTEENGDSINATISENIENNYSDIDRNYAEGIWGNNQRFFSLRGPLMLHSWGYDREGFPVPNSSGEYQLNRAGQIMFDPNTQKPLYKNQIRQRDGTYSKPYKESTFRKGWAQLPTTWPIGPIDLRWDEDAGVWTVGSNYKLVWITIEHDIVTEDPVRGVIEDTISDSTPLPNNLRKLVFVRDSSGLFRSPRGAALYCKYDSDSGFYQPIYNRPLITTGTIINGTLVDVDQAYTIKSAKAMAEYDRNGGIGIKPIIAKYRTVYENPLELIYTTGKKGIFSYINGRWTLTNAS